MATVVSITNPITGAVEQVDKLDHTAQQIDDAVALAPQLSNPNLLDNWYFGNPVNQRNVSGAIDAVGYFLDRWKLVSGSVTIGSNGITLNGTIAQILETAVGTDVTASALTTEGVVVASYDNNSKTISLTGTGQTFVAAKLELGSQQTLAHKDANGNWVLNDIPDYGEQLRRCRRYQRKIFISMLTATYVWNQMIQFSLNDVLNGMRATPALTLFGKQMDTATPSTDGFMAVVPGGNGDSGWTASAGTTYSLLVENNSITIKAIIPESKFTVTSNSGLNYALHCGEGVYIFADANL